MGEENTDNPYVNSQIQLPGSSLEYSTSGGPPDDLIVFPTLEQYQHDPEAALRMMSRNSCTDLTAAIEDLYKIMQPGERIEDYLDDATLELYGRLITEAPPDTQMYDVGQQIGGIQGENFYRPDQLSEDPFGLRSGTGPDFDEGTN